VDQLIKGAEIMAHSATLLKAELIALRRANELVSQRRKRKKRLIQEGGSLSIQAGQDLLTAVNTQLLQEQRERKRKREPNEVSIQCCRKCREAGHNSRTCTIAN